MHTSLVLLADARRGQTGNFGAASRAALCPRVGRVVDPRQVLEVQMSVDLGSGDVGVAQQLLHCAQVGAGFQ